MAFRSQCLQGKIGSGRKSSWFLGLACVAVLASSIAGTDAQGKPGRDAFRFPAFRATPDDVVFDANTLLWAARENHFAQFIGAQDSAGSDNTRTMYNLVSPLPVLTGVACSSPDCAYIEDHFAVGGHREFWAINLALHAPAWASADYQTDKTNIIAKLGPLVPHYNVVQDPGTNGIGFQVGVANKDEGIVIDGNANTNDPIYLYVYHVVAGKPAHVWVAAPPLNPGQLSRLASAMTSLVLEGLDDGRTDFAGFHPALTDTGRGHNFSGAGFIQQPEFTSDCDLEFIAGNSAGTDDITGEYEPAEPPKWDMSCWSKDYKNSPMELLSAVVDEVAPIIPAGYMKTSNFSNPNGVSVKWTNPQSAFTIRIEARKNRPTDAHPERSAVLVSVMHADAY